MKDKKIVLITEDEKVLRETLHSGLEGENITVVEARNGQEGLDLSLSLHPDIILLDLIMPKMDGLTMLEKIRNHDAWGQKVPVILLTNLTSSDEQRNNDMARLTPTYYFEKTEMGIEQIIEKIKEILKVQ